VLASHPATTRSTDFRRTAATFPTGVTVVSSTLSSVPVGMTVNAFTTVSLDPVLLLVCLHSRSRLLTFLRGSGGFAVTVLAEDQGPAARWFADRSRPTGAAAFTGLDVAPAPATGSPVLTGGVAYFDCLVHGVQAAGDHTIVTGAAQAFGRLSDKAPLLFHDGALGTIGEVAGRVGAAAGAGRDEQAPVG
jgi:flavin reductase (DIM6/NTAB) family NADH-FMN oxidoreductase RutF